MKTGKFIALILDNNIDYEIDEKENTIKVFTCSKMSQDYVFVHSEESITVRFSHTIVKWNGRFRKGTEIGRKFLHNLEFAPHRITGKRKAV